MPRAAMAEGPGVLHTTGWYRSNVRSYPWAQPHNKHTVAMDRRRMHEHDPATLKDTAARARVEPDARDDDDDDDAHTRAGL
jgi:hypothetical protein